MNPGERPGDFRFLIRDRGPDFTRSPGAVFQAAGTTILPTAVQARTRLWGARSLPGL